MRNLLTTFIIVTLSALSYAQDTLSSTQMHYGHHFYTIVNESDTSIHSYRSDGSLESVRPINSGAYFRYYPSGEIMWKQQRSNNQANGNMDFYSEKGRLVGTLTFRNDSIVDTAFMAKNSYLLFGRFTYNSTIYGGMQRPDGSSNISKSEGPRIFAPLYLVKHEKSEETKKYAEFSVDYNGYFFTLVTKGSYGIFPGNHSLELVTPEMGAPLGRAGSGVNSGWNITSPIEIQEKYCYLSLHVHSTGYAP
ncbi:MAG: hypothetical protein Crog4KO_00870 [Crocinitomicaceae bacterium]